MPFCYFNPQKFLLSVLHRNYLCCFVFFFSSTFSPDFTKYPPNRNFIFQTELSERVSQTVAKYFHDTAFIYAQAKSVRNMNRERDGMRFVSLPENIKLEKHSFVFCVLSQAEELLHFLRAATKPESPMQSSPSRWRNPRKSKSAI